MPADTRYRPPTKVTTLTVPFKTLVVRADPDFERLTRREPFYEFSSRTFYGNNATSGPYIPAPAPGDSFLYGADGAGLLGADGAQLLGVAQ